MKNKNESKIIAIACTLTALLVGVFTLSQGTIKFGKEDNYESKVDENLDPYYIVDTIKESDNLTVVGYINDDLSDEEVKALVKKVNSENKGTYNNYNINLYEDEESANDFENNKAKIVIEYENENNILLKRRYTDIEDKEVELPEYTLISIKNVYDEENNNESLKTKINVAMYEDLSAEDALANIKAIGNFTRGIRSTYDILNIVSYTSDYKDEYWEYSGHYKNDIVYSRIIDLE